MWQIFLIFSNRINLMITSFNIIFITNVTFEIYFNTYVYETYKMLGIKMIYSKRDIFFTFKLHPLNCIKTLKSAHLEFKWATLFIKRKINYKTIKWHTIHKIQLKHVKRVFHKSIQIRAIYGIHPKSILIGKIECVLERREVIRKLNGRKKNHFFDCC